MGARARSRHAVKAVEQLGELLGGDADAGVADRQDGLPIAAAERHLDLPFEGELEGVGEQVEDDLLPQVAIDEDRLVERLDRQREAEAGLVDRRLEGAWQLPRPRAEGGGGGGGVPSG